MVKKKEKYDFSLYEYHNLMNQNILVSYKGPIDERIMTVIGENILLVTNDGGDKAKNKIFKVFFIFFPHKISKLFRKLQRANNQGKEVGRQD